MRCFGCVCIKPSKPTALAYKNMMFIALVVISPFFFVGNIAFTCISTFKRQTKEHLQQNTSPLYPYTLYFRSSKTSKSHPQHALSYTSFVPKYKSFKRFEYGLHMDECRYILECKFTHFAPYVVHIRISKKTCI